MDKYDAEIDTLTKYPRLILKHWDGASPLFQFACGSSGFGCGCLTQVRSGVFKAETLELTNAIRADERIPIDPDEITVETLPVFAEWQRKIDKALNRD